VILNKRVCYAAIEVGVIEVVQWLRSREDACFPWRVSVCSNAVVHGHLDLLKWLRSQVPPCPWNEGVCKYAAWRGHIGILQWARAQSPPCPWNIQECIDAVWGSEEHDREKMMDWLQRFEYSEPADVDGYGYDPCDEVIFGDSENNVVF